MAKQEKVGFFEKLFGGKQKQTSNNKTAKKQINVNTNYKQNQNNNKSKNKSKNVSNNNNNNSGNNKNKKQKKNNANKQQNFEKQSLGSRNRGESADTNTTPSSIRLESKKRNEQKKKQNYNKEKIVSQIESMVQSDDVNRVFIINKDTDKTQVSLLEDGVLAEHYVTSNTTGSIIDNVYLGRVTKILPNMEAAFVDIGTDQGAILYASEINWNLVELNGESKLIENVLKKGDLIIVQVTKDPHHHKGAKLNQFITLSSRNILLTTQGNGNISKKISDAKRDKIKELTSSLTDINVVVRETAETTKDNVLEKEITKLIDTWNSIKEKSKSKNSPTLLYKADHMVIRILRDFLNTKFSNIIVQGEDCYNQVKDYLSIYMPEIVNKLTLWKESKNVYTHYKINEELEKGLQRIVHLKSGGSIVIDRVEAMTVIDVNTGRFIGETDDDGNELSLEDIITKTNLEAAQEIPKQLRLRDMGGIIIVDFIDMLLEKNRDSVIRRLIEVFARDRSLHNVSEITKLGLVEITRKQIGQGLMVTYSEKCEACLGLGRIIDRNMFNDDFNTDVNVQIEVKNTEKTQKQPEKGEIETPKDTKQSLNKMFEAAKSAKDS